MGFRVCVTALPYGLPPPCRIATFPAVPGGPNSTNGAWRPLPPHSTAAQVSRCSGFRGVGPTSTRPAAAAAKSASEIRAYDKVARPSYIRCLYLDAGVGDDEAGAKGSSGRLGKGLVSGGGDGGGGRRMSNLRAARSSASCIRPKGVRSNVKHTWARGAAAVEMVAEVEVEAAACLGR